MRDTVTPIDSTPIDAAIHLQDVSKVFGKAGTDAAYRGHDGVRRVIDMASRMGINTSRFEPVVSTTLGTNGVHPLEMAQAS